MNDWRLYKHTTMRKEQDPVTVLFSRIYESSLTRMRWNLDITTPGSLRLEHIVFLLHLRLFSSSVKWLYSITKEIKNQTTVEHPSHCNTRIGTVCTQLFQRSQDGGGEGNIPRCFYHFHYGPSWK